MWVMCEWLPCNSAYTWKLSVSHINHKSSVLLKKLKISEEEKKSISGKFDGDP